MTSTRRRVQQPLNTLESLLVAQIVWKNGDVHSTWPAMAKTLSKHPLVSRPKSFFTAQSCRNMYETLMKDANLIIDETCSKPQAKVHWNLSAKYYNARAQELRDMISAEETKFKTVLKEIEDIRSGLWDMQIKTTLTGTAPESTPALEGPTQSEDVMEVDSDAGAGDQRTSDGRDTLTGVPESTSAEETATLQAEKEPEPSATSAPQEEEEEEVSEDLQAKDDEGSTASQGQPQDTQSEKSADAETASEAAPTPAAEAPTPEAGQLDGNSSAGEEQVVSTRRSTRRRKSSAASAPVRKSLRSKGRVSEANGSENEEDAEVKDQGSQGEEDQEGPASRRKDGKRKASFVEGMQSPPEQKRMREDSEEEEGPSTHNTRARVTRHTTRTEEQVASKRFQNVIGMLHSQISQHRNGNIFHNPIKNSEAPDYHEIVKRPMDLKTIKTRVKDGIIANSLEFQRDIYLMFANAMMYNRPDSDVHTMAEDMMLESEALIQQFRQTEGLAKRGQRP